VRSAVGAVLLGIVGALSGLVAAPAAATTTDQPVERVLVISLPTVSWADLEEYDLPAIEGLLADSAVADLSTRSVLRFTGAGDAYTTIGAGTRARSRPSVEGLSFSPGELYGGQPAETAFLQRLGRSPDGSVFSIGQAATIERNRALRFDAEVQPRNERLFARLGWRRVREVVAAGLPHVLMRCPIGRLAAAAASKRPLGRLLASIQRVDEGDLTARAPVVSDDELGVLTERFNRMVEQLREKEYLRETFGRYVPKRIADAILENRGALKPQKRVATILFTDIQDFTGISEGLAAEQLMTTLNEYFSSLVEIVERHGGVVIQFQGDGFLVSFNVPVEDPAHAQNAVRAAQEIEQLINHRRFGDDVEFITRVGINSGVVIAGPVGAENRHSYSVLGDTVNLAARLEALNKDYGTRILVAESTRVLAGHSFRFRPLGEIAVRGKSEPVSVFTLM